MRIRKLQKAFVIGVLAITSGYGTQALAAPIFTFTEYSGFADDVGMANYSGLVAGDANLLPAGEPVYRSMSWPGKGKQPKSSLQLESATTPGTLLADTWTTISTLTHNNIIIPGAVSWKSQNIWGRLVITDSDGAMNTVLDSDNFITIALTETQNKGACPAPNPLGTICDDYFTFTAGLEDLYFSANDGSEWLAIFRLGNMVNAVQMGYTVFTGEGMTSHMDVQVMVTSAGAPALLRLSNFTSVSEPATLSVLGLGLLGLGIGRRRKLNVGNNTERGSLQAAPLR